MESSFYERGKISRPKIEILYAEVVIVKLNDVTVERMKKLVMVVCTFREMGHNLSILPFIYRE